MTALPGRRWRMALVALAAALALSWAAVTYGMPWLADVASRTVPVASDRALGREGLAVLDELYLEPTALPRERRAALQERFATMTAPLVDGHRYRLELRRGGDLGATALALPSGIIVLTDELVALAQSDEEIVAVLAHQVGHVRGRHSLRMLLQRAGVSALAFMVLGDADSIASLAAAIPTQIQAGYSRDFEREADAFSSRWLREHGIPAASFDRILCRLAPAGEHAGVAASGGSHPRAAGFFSSHPPPDERARCPEAQS